MTDWCANQKEGPCGPSPCDFEACLQIRALDHERPAPAYRAHSDAWQVANLIGSAPEVFAVNPMLGSHVAHERAPAEEPPIARLAAFHIAASGAIHRPAGS